MSGGREERASCAYVPCMPVTIYNGKSTCTQCGGGEPGARKAHKMLLGGGSGRLTRVGGIHHRPFYARRL